jgi:hypothetical protein
MDLAVAQHDLLSRTAKFDGFPYLPELDIDALRNISRQTGIDFATALLFDRVKKAHAEFIDKIDRLRANVDELTFDRNVAVGIVPASFYKEKPRSGADGHVILEATARAGISAELIPLHSVGTLAQNSEVILKWLRERAGQRIILISLCKGAADLKVAFNSQDSLLAFKNTVAWINICGTPNGSPIAQWLLGTKIRFLVSWLFLKTTRRNFQFLKEIIPGVDGPLCGPIKIPPHLEVINVAGFPLREHLNNAFMRRCHALLASGGPNDGGVLLAEACRAPGLMYPVWGSDHYLRPEATAQEIVLAILAFVMNKPALSSLARIQPEPCRAI